MWEKKNSFMLVARSEQFIYEFQNFMFKTLVKPINWYEYLRNLYIIWNRVPFKK